MTPQANPPGNATVYVIAFEALVNGKMVAFNRAALQFPQPPDPESVATAMRLIFHGSPRPVFSVEGNTVYIQTRNTKLTPSALFNCAAQVITYLGHNPVAVAPPIQ